MKVFLVFIFCWILGLSQGEPKLDEEHKDFHKICSAECNVSSDFVDRFSRLEYKSTDEDLCFLTCMGRIFKIAENNKYKISAVKTLYESHKIVIDDDFKDLDISFKDPDFVEKVADWVTRNKQASLDLIDSIRGNVKKS